MYCYYSQINWVNSIGSTEMENLKLMEDSFAKAKASYALTRSRRIEKVESLGNRSGIEPIRLLSFEEFLKQ